MVSSDLAGKYDNPHKLSQDVGTLIDDPTNERGLVNRILIAHRH